MKTISAGQTIGILGGGQLGMMMAESAQRLGYRIHSYDTSAECPIQHLSDKHTVGLYDDLQALLEFAQHCDVVTYEFENIDAHCVEALCKVAYVPQGSLALKVCSHRLLEVEFVKALGVPVLECACVKSKAEIYHELSLIPMPFVLKTLSQGYDGHGQVWVHCNEDLATITELKPSLMMRKVELEKEISVICARGHGGVVFFPCIENVHTDGILDTSICPAHVSSKLSAEAQDYARRIVESLDYIGVMAFEFFIEDGQLIFNEMAPRPHNSGHFSIEGCTSSQFDCHIQAICGLELKQPSLKGQSVMVNVLGQHVARTQELVGNGLCGVYHDYGKQGCKVNRKMGHVTFVGVDASVCGYEFRSEIR